MNMSKFTCVGTCFVAALLGDLVIDNDGSVWLVKSELKQTNKQLHYIVVGSTDTVLELVWCEVHLVQIENNLGKVFRIDVNGFERKLSIKI